MSLSLKRKDGLAPATPQTTLEDTVLRETGQTKKGKYCAILSWEFPGIGKVRETEMEAWVPGAGAEKGGVTAQWQQFLEMDGGRSSHR